MDPNRTYEGEGEGVEMEPDSDYADDHIPDTAGDSSSHPEEIEDMKKRLKEMEEEAGALREMQAKVEKEMGSSATSDPANAAADATQAEKEEVDSRSIYVGNVDYGCSPEEVQQHFQSCGTVNRVTISTDRGGQPKGFAFVEFDEVEAVQNAILLNASELHGRQLKVSVKRTNVSGMKQHRGGRRPYYGGFRPGPFMAPPFYAPYAYGDKLFMQVKAMNIDSPGTLAGVVSQIFDKALMEPTFCEMYANVCSHLAIVLPDFSENNEKFTFKRLLLNKCQQVFERGEREEAEAEKTEEEGEVKQTPEQREEKRVKARRRMLGNIRLIGELYKKRMLTERIMHECIKKLLGPTKSPDEEAIEELCTLMSIIGEMIDHPKAKEYMDTYFDIMAKLSTNQRYSSRVRFMLKDAIDLRRNKWQQRRKVEGPKKIEKVHRDAAQEHQAQSTRLSRGGPVMNNPPMRRGPQMGLVSPVSQQPGIRGMAPPQSGRGGFAMHDVRFEDSGDRYHFDIRNMNPLLPLPQRVNRDESITLGLKGGLGRNMSIRGQPGVSNASSAMGDRMGSGPTNGFGSGTSSEYGYGSREGGMGMRMASPDERTRPPLGWGQRGLDRNFSAGSRPAPPVVNQQAGLVASSPSSTSLPDSVIKEKSVSAIREFYSAKDEKEVAMCIEELKSPGSYHLVMSTWVSDSFDRKEMERDVLYKLLVNLCKPSEGLFPQAQLHQGLETVLSTLEDAVNDAPKALEYLGRLFAKFISEDVMSLRDIGRLVCEGGEEPGMLIDAGLGGDVIGCTLEYIKVEKGDSFLNDVRAGSNLKLEDFKPPAPVRSKKLDPFL